MKLYIQVIYKDFSECGDVRNRMFFINEGQYTMTSPDGLPGLPMAIWLSDSKPLISAIRKIGAALMTPQPLQKPALTTHWQIAD